MPSNPHFGKPLSSQLRGTLGNCKLLPILNLRLSPFNVRRSGDLGKLQHNHDNCCFFALGALQHFYIVRYIHRIRTPLTSQILWDPFQGQLLYGTGCTFSGQQHWLKFVFIVDVVGVTVMMMWMLVRGWCHFMPHLGCLLSPTSHPL